VLFFQIIPRVSSKNNLELLIKLFFLGVLSLFEFFRLQEQPWYSWPIGDHMQNIQSKLLLYAHLENILQPKVVKQMKSLKNQ